MVPNAEDGADHRPGTPPAAAGMAAPLAVRAKSTHRAPPWRAQGRPVAGRTPALYTTFGVDRVGRARVGARLAWLWRGQRAGRPRRRFEPLSAWGHRTLHP